MRESSSARFYELMVITTPEGTPEELVETVEQINGYITGAGGSIIRTNYDSPWGRRRLAYPIRHHSHDVRDGFYTLIHLEINPDKVIDVEREMKLNDRLMRYLVLQLSGEPVFPEPEVEDEEGEGAEGAAEGGETATAEAAPQEQATEGSAEERRSVAAAEPEAAAADADEETSESDTSDTTEEEAEPVSTPAAEEAREESDVSQ